MKTSGIQAALELLHGAGVRHIFGNPGTTELPLNEALVSDRRFQYILGLQEVPVMAMADGYAMASGGLAVVNLHISCGLGHAMGILYNAFREGTPLLVTAGQTSRKLRFEDPILAGDMVAVARPWTKWSAEVNRVEDVPNAIRRAVQAALTPPTGPVFLSLPVDVQMELAEGLDLTPPRLPSTRVRPPLEALQRAVEVLLSAKNPAILAGSRVTERDAVQELVAVAERLGAPVISEPGTTHGRLAFPCEHPLYGQGLPLWSPEIRERLKEYDALLVVGMDLLRLYMHHEPDRPLPEQIKLVQLDEDPWQLNKNYPLDVGILGDTKAGLADLGTMLRLCEPQLAPEQRELIRTRTLRHIAAHQAARNRLEKDIAGDRELRPLTPRALMGSLARTLPDNVAVIEEAVTTTNTTFERLGALKNTTGYFGHRGWALGWGLGVSIGVKLAWPERPVLALLGEGAASYGIQGLWSAARYQLPVVFVICNNAQYQILKIGAKGLQLPHALADEFEGLDLVGPEVDFVKVAEGFGVQAKRISEPDELCDTIQQAWQGNRPLLIDVPISRTTQPRLQYG
ncbi:Benzoylformate decarboxylase [Anatilimnocola aggregata]|uniref:Benzoylformate decarboxylase n=1 Tax=Anatilimnocola aggregata TaxID=2528021 RepID=A0A517Y4C5_9BACT|nr:thiamine pyrophosphate-dependent enzyme [Anatilimnocola aggregata]QDU25109.1 Benzoylformate decarboxylase [Anatilimnocola aggregata]